MMSFVPSHLDHIVAPLEGWEENIIADPVPGQMYAWEFEVLNGDWFIEYVTDVRRQQTFGGRNGLIKRGDLFTIITLDDPGPQQLPEYNEHGVPTVVKMRFHTALLHDSLFWIEHSFLFFAKLVE